MEEGSEAKSNNAMASGSRFAIQSAKASLLLSALSPNARITGHARKEIEDLRLKLARERLKNKGVKICGLFELLLQLAVLFSVFVFFTFLVFELHRS